jgi:4-phospho-D-threonate 3-dehydrogenase / 4-phospho-D-erythronate 3-dehydrogenase
MTDHIPRLAITMGDPAGVGPEIIVKACRRLQPRLAADQLRLLVIGHRSALDAARALLHDDLAFPEDAEGPLGFLAAGEEAEPVQCGAVAPEAGRFAYLAVARAVELALAGRIDAIVTAPLNKEALNLAGYHFAGHTDMLAALTNTRSSVMLLAHGDMRVGHVTTHVALADVPRLLTPERLRRTIDLTHAAVCDLGIAQPRLAVAALNPHAGEGGLFGLQDIEITAPVVEQCRAAGMDVTGPVPGDTVFVKLRARQFDAVVAMYHDQGHIPVKLLGFDVDPATGAWRALSGVNITLGLPVIRTSVDHGTAFDIAGKGIASEESLIEAIDYAERLAATRRATG